MDNFPEVIGSDVFLEAEVAPSGKDAFERRYHDVTGVAVVPGRPTEYQEQSNKWGTELRIYFDDDNLAEWMKDQGAEVEERERGYKSEKYGYRVNNNDIWWLLVEHEGFRLGTN